MDRLNIKIIISGLAFFYFVQFFAPNKPVYFLSYLIFAFYAYKATGNLIRSLVYTLIISFFSDTNIAASLFKLDPDIGSGYYLSPLTLCTVMLLIASIRKLTTKISWIDITAILILFWNVFLFLLNPNPNSLYGILTLGEMIIAFFLLRNNLKSYDLKVLPLIFSSMLLFQSAVSVIQFITHGNIGILAETSNFDYPFGLATDEEAELFRSSGTAYHANALVMFLIILLPYIFYYQTIISNALKIIWIFVLFSTFARVGWLMGLLEFLYLSLPDFKTRIRFKINYTVLFVISLIIAIIIFPLFLVRLETLPEAFSENGSWGFRFKTYNQAIYQIGKSPLLGSGPNMYLTNFLEDPQTDLYEDGKVNVFEKVHNFFLEVFLDNGIIGLILMAFFLYRIYKYPGNLINSKKNKIQIFSKIAFITLIIFVQVHPIFLSPQMRLIYLLSAIIMVR